MARYERRERWRRGLSAVGVGAAALALLGADCGDNGLHPATGDVEVTVLRGVDTEGSLCPITRIHWMVNPVLVPPRPDGSVVGMDALDEWSSLSGGTGTTSGGTAEFPVVCVHSQTFSARAPGTWSISGKAVQGNAPACNVEVTAGGTSHLTFVFNVGGTAESCH